MGIETSVSLVICNFVFLFIHIVRFRSGQSIPVAGVHLFLQRVLRFDYSLCE